jgi:hypothetical protein
MESTLITLSHWPKSGTPKALKADSSAEIVFNYLDSPEFHVEAQAVSNNHFDEDGLVGVYALVEPQKALAHRQLLIDVAWAGDFGVCRDRTAARIAFAIGAHYDPARSPLDRAIFDLPYPEMCGRLYEEMLPRFESIYGQIERFKDLWRDEDAALTASQDALEGGAISIEEFPEADLAVVRVGEGVQLHEMTVHGATDCTRILELHDEGPLFRYRYESWVQITSRPIRPRADLAPLAEALTAEESQGHWTFDGVDQITPKMRLEGAGQSALSSDELVRRFVDFLAEAPPAWDPYD